MGDQRLNQILLCADPSGSRLVAVAEANGWRVVRPLDLDPEDRYEVALVELGGAGLDSGNALALRRSYPQALLVDSSGYDGESDADLVFDIGSAAERIPKRMRNCTKSFSCRRT